MRWALQSTPGAGRVYATTPFDLSPDLLRELQTLGRRLDRLLRHVADVALAGRGRAPGEASLPMLPALRGAGPLAAPYFWARFDVFERADGELAVLEYNCDKPTSQREIWASGELPRHGANPNRHARAAFRAALVAAWAGHRRRHRRATPPRRPRVAILLDPAHREELHLAYVYGGEIARLGWPWVVAGPDNLGVADGRPVAFGAPVDVVLRQYPTDFLHELPAMDALWTATLAGRLLWLNDPRAVLAQAKSALALLWELAEADALSAADRALVHRHVPETGLASQPGWLARAAARREDWVLKPVFGRFSEDVTMGAAATATEWDEALARARGRPDDYVVQAYVPPRRRWLPGPDGPRAGYANWGVYLVMGRPVGLLPRFQPSPLTEDETMWWAPLRLTRAVPATLRVRRPAGGGGMRATGGAGRAWEAIADGAALRGYVNAWTGGLANFTLAALELGPADRDALESATHGLAAAIDRAVGHLRGRAELLSAIGVPRGLTALAAADVAPAAWRFLARLDWARLPGGAWRLLEINSDTPAGLWEAADVTAAVARRHPGLRPVGTLGDALAASWRDAVADALGEAAPAAPLGVGLVGLPGVPEDADQLRAHARAARAALPAARLRTGHVDDLHVRDGRAWLGDLPIDVLFRYYPLHWMPEAGLAPVLELVAAGRLLMLPPAAALVAQSKAFLALLRELAAQGFFPATEAAAVRAHVPPTVLDPAALGRRPYVAKPYLEHEGRGVRFSAELDPRARQRLAAADMVYQERLPLPSARLPVATARGWRTEARVLVVGAFLAGDRLAGLYTRAGAPITGREAVFVPVLARS